MLKRALQIERAGPQPEARGQGLRALLAASVAFLLALNAASVHGAYGAGMSFWSSPALLISLFALCVVANGYLLPAHFVSAANIFLVLLFLLHMGYYLPVRLGVAHSLPYMPPVYGYGAIRVLSVFCAALLSLETGYLLATLQCSRRAVRGRRELINAEWTSVARYSGYIIAALSCLSLLVFLMQAGGFMGLLELSYSGLFALLRESDSRFAFTAMWFAPIGLLLWRVGMLEEDATSGSGLRLWWLSAALLLGPFLLIGARGPCFLFALGVTYLQHVYVRPCRPAQFCLLGLVVAVAAPMISSYRNTSGWERVRGVDQWRFKVSAPLLEAGSTYRPYCGILEMLDSGQQEFLGGESYWTAIRNLVPNLGEASRLEPGRYYRASAWFNYRLSPIDDAAGVGIGCSIVAEQYANFGYFGVVGVFTALGMTIVALESRAVACGSTLARAILAIVFVPLCWYIRDDIFGCVRMFVWPILMLWMVRVCRLPVFRMRLHSKAVENALPSGGEA